MLWEQIDARSVAKISGELKVKLGVVEASGKIDARQLNIHDKLKVVLRYLNINEQVGGIGSGKPFVRGVVPMTWQGVDFGGQSDLSIVLFSGCTGIDLPHALEQESILVGLVGSASYITGTNDLKTAGVVYGQPKFWAQVVDKLNSPMGEELEGDVCDPIMLRRPFQVINDIGDNRRAYAPKPLLEFVAKTFLRDGNLLVGSPLYVSHTQKDPLVQNS